MQGKILTQVKDLLYGKLIHDTIGFLGGRKWVKLFGICGTSRGVH